MTILQIYPTEVKITRWTKLACCRDKILPRRGVKLRVGKMNLRRRSTFQTAVPKIAAVTMVGKEIKKSSLLKMLENDRWIIYKKKKEQKISLYTP